jgi:NTP pyrophosphatase (non-canonical NTP hydrolase)
MNLTEYKKIITETAVFPRKVDDFGLAYCIIGLIDEMDEVIEKVSSGTATTEEIYSEIGDVCWYLCALCNELNVSFEDVIENRENLDNYHIFQLFGKIKKHYRDSKPFDLDQVSRILSSFAYGLLKGLSEENIQTILQNNYDKLIARRETNTLHGDGDNREKQK